MERRRAGVFPSGVFYLLLIVILLPLIYGRGEAANVDMSGVAHLGASDGVILGLNRNDGTWSDLSLNGKEIMDVQGRGSSPFSICDVTRGREFIPLKGPVIEEKGEMRQELTCKPLGLEAQVDYRVKPGNGYVEIHVRVADTIRTDRGLMLRFEVPVNALNGYWWDDIQRSRQIQKGGRYEYTVPLKGFADLPEFRDEPHLSIGRHDRNFLSAITARGGDFGICLAVPLDQPRIYRTGYDSDARRFYIIYDFALSPEMKEPCVAEFTFFLYGFDAEWGMRGALEVYYRYWPGFFEKHVEREGQWIAFTELRQIDNANEFYFQIQEGAGDAAYDDKLGVYSFTYLTHAGKYANIPGYDPSKDPLPPLSRQVEAMESAFMQETGSYNMFKECGLHDADGHFAISKAIAYAHLIAQFNPDPELPYGRWLLANTRSKIMSFRSKGANLDGFYYDGLPSGLNYRRDHFAYSDSPPIFDPIAGKPALNNFFSSVEFARAMAEALHKEGKYTMMNGALGASPFVAPYLDVLGAETGLNLQREELNYIRMVTYQKPFVTLLKGNFSQYTHENIESFMKRCLAYGVFPGFFDWYTSGLGPGSRYWDHAEWYERDRSLHRKYLPLCETIAAAGWEPVTYARTAAADLFIERFGNFQDGDLFFTIMNERNEARRIDLRIAAKELNIGVDDMNELVIFDAINEVPLQFEPQATGDVLVHLEISGGDVLVLQVAKKVDFVAYWIHRVEESLERRRIMAEVNQKRVTEPMYWRPHSDGCEMDIIDGNPCLKLENSFFNIRSRGAWQWIMLYQPQTKPLTIRFRVRAEKISGKADEGFAVRAKLAYVDNFTTYETKVLPLESGTYDWKTVEMEITPARPVRSIQLSLVMEGKRGTAWFDDVQVLSSHQPGKDFVVDGGFTYWYEQPTSSVKKRLDEEFDTLFKEVNGLKSHDTPQFLTALGGILSKAEEIESWIKGEGLENPCRREVRELADLKRHLSSVSAFLLGIEEFKTDVTDMALPGEHLQVATSLLLRRDQTLQEGVEVTFYVKPRNGAELIEEPSNPLLHTLEGRTFISSNYQVVMPSNARPGDEIDLLTACRLTLSGRPALYLETTRTIRIAAPMEAELRLKGLGCEGQEYHFILRCRNNMSRAIEVHLAPHLPSAWVMSISPDKTLPVNLMLSPNEEIQKEVVVAPPTGTGIGRYQVGVELTSQEQGLMRSLPLSQEIWFIPPALNRVRNHGFEEVTGGTVFPWSPYFDGYRLDDEIYYSGKWSICLQNESPAGRRGVVQSIQLNQSEPKPILVRTVSRAEDVSGTPNNDYSLYVDIYYIDGTPLYGQTFKFNTGSHDWQFGEILIRPAKPIRTVNIYLLLRGKTGKVWFDDVMMAELNADIFQ